MARFSSLVAQVPSSPFSTLRTAFNIAYREWKVIAPSPFEGWTVSALNEQTKSKF